MGQWFSVKLQPLGSISDEEVYVFDLWFYL